MEGLFVFLKFVPGLGKHAVTSHLRAAMGDADAEMENAAAEAAEAAQEAKLLGEGPRLLIDVATAQAQHGLRHNDFGRYRQDAFDPDLQARSSRQRHCPQAILRTPAAKAT